MVDLPAMLLVGPRKIILDKPDAVTVLYQSLGDSPGM